MFIRHYLFIFALAIITCDALQCLECDDDYDNKPNCANPTIITNKTCTTCWASQRLIDARPWEMGCSTQEHEFCRQYTKNDFKCYCKEDRCNRKIRKIFLRDSYVKILGDSLVCFECNDNDSNQAKCNNATIIPHQRCKSCYAKQVEGHGSPYEMGCSTGDNRFCTDYSGQDYKCYCQEDGCNTNVEKYFLDKNYKRGIDKTKFGMLWISNNTGNSSVSTIFAFTDDVFKNQAIFFADKIEGQDNVIIKKDGSCVHKGVFYKDFDKTTPIKASITNENCTIFKNPNDKRSYKPGNYTALTDDGKYQIIYGINEFLTIEIKRRNMKRLLKMIIP